MQQGRRITGGLLVWSGRRQAVRATGRVTASFVAAGEIRVLAPRLVDDRFGVGASPGGLTATPLTGIGARIAHLAFVGSPTRLVAATGTTLDYG